MHACRAREARLAHLTGRFPACRHEHNASQQHSAPVRLAGRRLPAVRAKEGRWQLLPQARRDTRAGLMAQRSQAESRHSFACGGGPRLLRLPRRVAACLLPRAEPAGDVRSRLLRLGADRRLASPSQDSPPTVRCGEADASGGLVLWRRRSRSGWRQRRRRLYGSCACWRCDVGVSRRQRARNLGQPIRPLPPGRRTCMYVIAATKISHPAHARSAAST